MYEEYAYIIDLLPHGRGFRAEPLAQVVGEQYFTLLEVVLRPNVSAQLHEKVYIGKDARDKVLTIRARLSWEELSPRARLELPIVVERIVREREERFINFFNTTSAITPRMHALELVPGIGKKYMWDILRKREEVPFKSYEDLQKRTGIPNPVKLLTKRILEEIRVKENKYRLFTRAP